MASNNILVISNLKYFFYFVSNCKRPRLLSKEVSSIFCSLVFKEANFILLKLDVHDPFLAKGEG